MTVAFNTQVAPTRLTNGLIEAVQTLSGSADALALKDGSAFIASTGVDATTLATPIAGTSDSNLTGQDGLEILIYATTAHAHTITTAAGIINATDHIATFGGAVGDYIRLIAFNGYWWVADNNGITLS